MVPPVALLYHAVRAVIFTVLVISRLPDGWLFPTLTVPFIHDDKWTSPGAEATEALGLGFRRALCWALCWEVTGFATMSGPLAGTPHPFVPLWHRLTPGTLVVPQLQGFGLVQCN